MASARAEGRRLKRLIKPAPESKPIPGIDCTQVASALIELSQLDKSDEAKSYLDFAEQQVRSLSSPEYLAEKGTNCNFVLKHSTGHLPGNSEVDVPLSYADYYYVEALMRLKKLI